jgi:hypothetical protein
MNQHKFTVTVRFSDDMIAEAREQAERFGEHAFRGHLERLVAKELENGGDDVVELSTELIEN